VQEHTLRHVTTEISVSAVPDLCTTRYTLLGIYTERYNHKKLNVCIWMFGRKNPCLWGGEIQLSGHDIDAITTMPPRVIFVHVFVALTLQMLLSKPYIKILPCFCLLMYTSLHSVNLGVKESDRNFVIKDLRFSEW